MLVDSSTVICWTSLFVILGCRIFFVAFILILMEYPVSNNVVVVVVVLLFYVHGKHLRLCRDGQLT